MENGIIGNAGSPKKNTFSLFPTQSTTLSKCCLLINLVFVNWYVYLIILCLYMQWCIILCHYYYVHVLAKYSVKDVNSAVLLVFALEKDAFYARQS